MNWLKAIAGTTIVLAILLFGAPLLALSCILLFIILVVAFIKAGLDYHDSKE